MGSGEGKGSWDAKSEHTEVSASALPSCCGMARRSSVAPARPPSHFRLAGGAGGDRLATAPTLHAGWGGITHDSGAAFPLLNPGDPPFLFSFEPVCIGPALTALLGGRECGAPVSRARWSRHVWSRVGLGTRHNKSKCSTPPRVSKNHLAQLCTVRHARLG